MHFNLSTFFFFGICYFISCLDKKDLLMIIIPKGKLHLTFFYTSEIKGDLILYRFSFVCGQVFSKYKEAFYRQ